MSLLKKSLNLSMAKFLIVDMFRELHCDISHPLYFFYSVRQAHTNEHALAVSLLALPKYSSKSTQLGLSIVAFTFLKLTVGPEHI